MKKLDHPNLIRLYEVIDSSESDNMYLGKPRSYQFNSVMEYASQGAIMEWDEEEQIFKNPRKEGFYTEDELRPMFQGMVAGLDYCTIPLYHDP